MQPLQPEDLMTLERYAREREAFRSRVLAHKQARQLAIGPEVTWSFEDRLTIQYQVQEMLRIEKIFEPAGIAGELSAYNQLITDGGNLKATMLLEIPDPQRRRQRLAELRGVEDRCWLRVDDGAPVYAIADEDLERANEEKTSAVHFLRFELPAAMIARLRAGAPLAMGIDHPGYRHDVQAPSATIKALLADLE